ncbi:AbrB family transcriptional regulator [Oceaniovalibus sp. ACAM 378]|uniref:AbrB family transcriptional regulator n=1 Tax=Oceaniovalibus sp. ACAM 378 TaxID=2599923 RepID=UPI0011D7B8D9|nr:AbrB family transcriptional regulator [Oceaniovalibus sp. ACAM 378]TYB85056.1 AbrB family transcriptional regulator [Oceaniovalibus sp. ACAM 378]
MTRVWLFTALLLLVGALGGAGALLIGLPLPWMLGSILTTALLVAMASERFPAGYAFPMWVRMIFIAVIGAMIGAQVDADLIQQWRSMLASLTGVAVFVLAAHGMNYWLFRRIGGYDKATAFYCGTPGGLMESLAMGEEAGADLRVLTIQQFLRIILVVSLVPLGLSLMHGSALGSAAGLSFVDGVPTLRSIPVLLVVAAVGLVVGHVLRLPAGQLTGPLIVSAVAGVTGLIELSPPGWVIGMAQVVIGVSLGIRFVGITGAMLRRGLWLSLLSVGAMMAMAVALAVLLHTLTGQSIEVLVLSFAPGGVTEMGLVALSLAANPAMVAFHHLFRITLTVLGMAVVGRRLLRK